LFWRIINIGKDHRFDDVRENSFKFLVWFLLQFVTIWLISLPFIIINSPSKSDSDDLIASDYVGWAIWLIGFVCEAIADQQKFQFRNDKSNKDKWCDVGIWKLSRHPNYFGEICCWWGIFISCASILVTWEWFSIVSPVYITVILMFGSGIPTTEKSTDKRFWTDTKYQEYKQRTPVLIPFIPGLCGGGAKTICCCELPLYNYPPNPERQSLS